MPFRRVPGLVIASLVLAGALLAACSTAPFDATSPWRPTTDTTGRSYSNGLQGSVPESNFAAYDSDAEERADIPSEVPSRGGENPWATVPQNPVVTVCYGSAINAAEAVREEARRMCPKGSTLRLEMQDSFWNGCPLLQPNRAAFRCLTGGQSTENTAETEGQDGG